MQLINSVKKARYTLACISAPQHFAGINMFQKLSGYVKAHCPNEKKRITKRYLKSEQISITGIRCTFTRGNGVGARMKASAEMRYTNDKKNITTRFSILLSAIYR